MKLRDPNAGPMRTFLGTVIGFLVVCVIVTVIGAVINEAKAYEVCSTARTVARSTACAPYTTTVANRKFYRGRFGDAHGRQVPKKFRTMLDRKYGRTVAARGLGDWWDARLNDAACVLFKKPSINGAFDCLPSTARQMETFNRKVSEAEHVVLKCGGKSLFGYYTYKVWEGGSDGVPGYWKIRKAGWVGIAATTTACSFEPLWDRWF